jgi:hypothetical protein
MPIFRIFIFSEIRNLVQFRNFLKSWQLFISKILSKLNI